jgi:tetratricopeptide (TPR) repeat protein
MPRTKATAGVEKHRWEFAARMRARAFGWRSSKLACQRLKEAVSEIKKVARRDPVLAGEGAVRLLEKIWPAFEHVDTSSGALGTAVNHAVDTLVGVLRDAPAADATRDKWLDRLFDAVQEDGVDYLWLLGDRWGEICITPERASRWADDLMSTTRMAWSDPNPGGFFRGATACLSALVMAGRYEEVLELLELRRYPSWHYRRYGVEALLAMGRPEEALEYAEQSRGLNQPDSAIAEACERILISAGRTEEAYRRYALGSNRRGSNLATFRAVAARYPDRSPDEILIDLMASTPAEEGKWFATAKELGHLDLALTLAERSPVDPKTLSRAARDYLSKDPRFALGAALAALKWLARGWGFDITGYDVVQVYSYAIEAAEALGRKADVAEEIRRIVDADTSPGTFVKQILGRRLEPG